MSGLARLTTLLLGIVVLAVVLAVCGEGACEACVHACCARSDRTDRLRSVMRSVFLARGQAAVFSASHGVCGRIAGFGHALSRPGVSACLGEVAPLRI